MKIVRHNNRYLHNYMMISPSKFIVTEQENDYMYHDIIIKYQINDKTLCITY